MPVAYALGLASILAALYIGIPLEAVMLKVAGGMSGFSLLAIPFFVLAGAIMAVGGMAERLVNLAKVFVGAIRGGMALVNILASTMFGCHLRLVGRRHGGGRIGDDPADDQERLPAAVRGERHHLGLAAAAARSALAQHDHLFDRGGRHDLDRPSVHGRHHSGAAARPVADHPRADHLVSQQLPEKRSRSAARRCSRSSSTRSGA